MHKQTIIKSLIKATGEKEVSLEIPENKEHGDYSSNVAMQILARKKGKAKQITSKDQAEEIIAKIKEDSSLDQVVAKVEIAGPGFINIFLTKGALLDNLDTIVQQGDKYGFSDLGKGKTVVVDYSSPNIAKVFGVGHLRSTIIGQALYNLYQNLGYKVVGDNHLGDWGTQFGKLLYMIDKCSVGAFDIDKLEALYIEFHRLAEKDTGGNLEEEARSWFKRLEDGDKKAREIWQKCVDVSMQEFNRIYTLLNVSIDYAYGESFYEGLMKKMLKDPKINEYLSLGEDGKAKIIDLTKEGIKTPLMFLKSDGATTYATRDLACIVYREKTFKPDIYIYEVGVEQTLHFIQVFAVARKLKLVGEDVIFYHTKHGLYLSGTGKKFQTRKGETVKLESVLTEAITRARKIIEKSETSRGLDEKEIENVAKAVGIGAIKYFDLAHEVKNNIVFNWEKIMNMEGNSGPYLQYTYARCKSVLAKAKEIPEKKLNCEELNKEETILLRGFIQYQDVVLDTATNYAPNLLCNYLFELAQKYNHFYGLHKIIGSDNEALRVKITRGCAQILKNGLYLLGINTPERM